MIRTDSLVAVAEPSCPLPVREARLSEIPLHHVLRNFSY
jgi:hypothetical protein